MKDLKAIVERLSRGRVVRRRMVVAGKSIPIFVSPDAQLKYLKFGAGAFDQDLIAIAEKYVNADNCVWDIGANVGTFTFAAAAMAINGTVISVEPDIWLAGLIRQTARLPEYAARTICILPAAVSNECSVATFLVASRGRASSALEMAGGRSQMGGVREKQHVPTLTLDTLLQRFPAPDFVKLKWRAQSTWCCKAPPVSSKRFDPGSTSKSETAFPARCSRSSGLHAIWRSRPMDSDSLTTARRILSFSPKSAGCLSSAAIDTVAHNGHPRTTARASPGLPQLNLRECDSVALIRLSGPS